MLRIGGLHIADWLTLLTYLAGITVLGMWMAKTIHNTTDFFIGGRRYGKLLQTFFTFGAGTHSDQAVGVAAKTFTTGMSGIWYQWMWLFVTPFYWILGAIHRRCRCLTLGDFFEARYGRSVALLCVVLSIANIMVNIGMMLKGSGAIIEAVTGKVSADLAIALITILFVAYGVAGGLAAAVVTDFVQGLMTILFSFMLLPLALHELGGFRGLHTAVAAAFNDAPVAGMNTSADMWSLVAPGEIGLFYIIVVTFNGLIGIVAQPGGVPGANSCRTEYDAQFGSVAGNLIKRVCTIAWVLTGMCAFAIFHPEPDPAKIDQSFGLIALRYLPRIAPGLIGIFLAGLLASIMSSCNAQMLMCSGLFTQNLYKTLTGARHADSHYLWVGRVSSALAVAGGVAFAYWFESVIHGLEFFWKISAMMGIAFWAALVWRRGTAAGAWVGTLLAFGVWLFTSDVTIGGITLWSFDQQITPLLPEFMRWQDRLYLPWQMIFYLTAGLAGYVITSLLTPRPDNRKLDRFYECLRTPAVAREVIDAPFTLPAGMQPSPAHKLINHPEWELYVPSARMAIGFGVICIIGAALIGVAAIIVRIGA